MRPLALFAAGLLCIFLVSADPAHAQSCAGLPNGFPCDDGNFCTASDICLSGSCTPGFPLPNGAPCNDGRFCDSLDICLSGTCVDNGSPCAGSDGDGDCSESCDEATDSCTAPDPNDSDCDDGNECTTGDRCNAGACALSLYEPDGTACGSDGAFCNGAEECQSGSCVSPGNPCDGLDGDGDCSETCNEAGNACNASDTNGSACDDGNDCTTGDSCTGGACAVSLNEPDGTACDDGTFCNGAEQCQSGSCVSPGNPCAGPDGDGDCSETCNEAGNACNASDPNGSACDDGTFCNGVDDACDGIGQCVPSGIDPCAGPDADGDCAESCDEASGTCTASDPDGSTCDDGEPCTLDTCIAGACDDHIDEVDDTPCEDGAFCNGSEACQAGACVSSGDPCVGDSDCSESCDEVGDVCFTLLQAGAVPDGLSVPGTQLALAHSSVAGDLDLLWGASCLQTDDDYAVYEGVLGDFTSHVPVGIPDCTTGGATTTTITPGAGDRYYLVVPQLLSEGIEGSYGFSSDGTPRTPSLSACGLQVVCGCPTKIVFVTSEVYDGDLGGLAGADATCQSLADAAGLPPRIYKAWLSDATTAVKDRFTQSISAYVRTDGMVIEDNWAGLIDNNPDRLLVPIDRDENGNAVATSYVWTGSSFAGSSLVETCSDWGNGTNASSGRAGRTDKVDNGWTSAATQTCENLRRLYCFEQ